MQIKTCEIKVVIVATNIPPTLDYQKDWPPRAPLKKHYSASMNSSFQKKKHNKKIDSKQIDTKCPLHRK